MSEQPNIVLVHGAWADGSSWSGVIRLLQKAGYNVTAPQFPLTSLEANVARLRQVLAAQTGPTLVAGHSYGCQIMTALGAGCSERCRTGVHLGLRPRCRRIDWRVARAR